MAWSRQGILKKGVFFLAMTLNCEAAPAGDKMLWTGKFSGLLRLFPGEESGSHDILWNLRLAVLPCWKRFVRTNAPTTPNENPKIANRTA